ncbi:VIR protein [Plasmodium vivax]|uniref:VIR protein n=1 Tax=Plasmodium vivax TaxID=5855 RepID=A0A1G4EIH1_PLAVI|nr:VIR protein [Plasmodium vivax]
MAYKGFCEFNFNDFLKGDVLEVLCAKFKYFYDLLFGPSDVNDYMNNENGEYLNFWLNKELTDGNISSISVPDFYSKLKSDHRSFDNQNKLKDKIFVIGKEELEHMNTLYDLYNIYNTIITLQVEDKKKCQDYYSVCVEKYTDSIRNCSNNKYTNFCNALKSFKEKYEKINSDSMGVCKSKNILPLPPEQTLLKEKNLDTEQTGGKQLQTLAGVPPQPLGTTSQETSEDSEQKVGGDLVQEVREDSVPETLEDTQQPPSLSVEGKQTDHYNRVVSVFSNRSLVKSSIRKK